MMNAKKIQILLIEDDEGDFVLTKEMLYDAYGKHFILDWASSYQDGLAMMAEADYDIYLVDYRLGAYSGLDLAQVAIAEGYDTPIILLTGQSAREVDLAAMETGVADYLIKGEVTGSMLERSIRYAIERHRNEEQLRLQARMLEVTANAIVITDADGIISWVNPAFTKLTGYKAVEVIGQSPRILNSGVHDPTFYEELWRSITRGDFWQGEIINKRKDGSLYAEEMTITPVLGAGGEVNQFIAIKQDISERKMVEDSLRESETRYRSIFETSQDALVILDLNGIIKDANPMMSKVYGYDHDELIGKSAKTFVHPDYHHAVTSFFKSVTSNESFQGNTVDVRKDGSTFYTDVRGSFYTVGEEPLLLAVIRDITEEKLIRQAENEQRILAEALRETAEMLNSTLDINEIFDHVLDNVDRVVPHDASNIRIFQDGIAEVVSQRGYVHRGIEDWISNLKIDIWKIPNLQTMSENLHPFLIPDTSVDPTWVQFPETSWIKSYLAVPIRRDGTAIGVISLDSETPNFFKEDHAIRLQAFADQVSVAMENASLYQDALLAAERRATLHQVSQEIVAASRSPERVYEAIHMAAAKLMPCEAFAITTTNGKRGQLEAVYLYDKGERYPSTRLEEEGSLSGAVIKSGKSILIDDLEEVSDLETSQFGAGDVVRSVLVVPMQLNGNAFGVIAAQSYNIHAYNTEDQRLLEMLAAYAATILESARLFDETQQHSHNQEMLNTITRTALATDDYETALQILADNLKKLLSADVCFITAWDEERKQAFPGAVSGVAADNYISLRAEPGEVTLTASVLEAQQPITATDVMNSPYISPRIAAKYPVTSMLGLPLEADGKKLGAALIAFSQVHEFTHQEIALGESAAAQISLAMAKIRLLDETNQRAAELEAVADVSEALRIAPTRDEMPPIILDHLIELLHVDGAALLTIDPHTGESEIKFAQGAFEDSLGLHIPAGECLPGHVMTIGHAYVADQFHKDSQIYLKNLVDGTLALASAPLIVQDTAIGSLIVGRTRESKNGSVEFTDIQIRLLTAIADIAANGLHRAELHDRTREQLERLTALHEIDMVISSSFDLQLPFKTLLNKVTSQIDVDAAAVLLLNSDLQQLEHAASRGFRTTGILHNTSRLGEPHAGVAALERRTIIVDNLAEDDRFDNKNLVVDEGFISYIAIPLMSKGGVNGVLELFNRTQVRRNPEWIDFVSTLATQASIAINNTQLFDEVQSSNMELSLAYDATIEGWSRALELRDMETEGHSRRVTEMTMKLARAMGISERELVHVRRGALLHDIGKMGIPDSILHKPGALTDEEWEIMREHPVYAFNLLAPISYLQPALDIPHYHHERWDGTGYPRGLKGEQIPLAARIFAISDVWDALSSDRPYRDAWPREKVIAYIKEQAGSHFDPRVVEAFIGIVETVAN